MGLFPAHVMNARAALLLVVLLLAGAFCVSAQLTCPTLSWSSPAQRKAIKAGGGTATIKLRLTVPKGSTAVPPVNVAVYLPPGVASVGQIKGGGAYVASDRSLRWTGVTIGWRKTLVLTAKVKVTDPCASGTLPVSALVYIPGSSATTAPACVATPAPLQLRVRAGAGGTKKKASTCAPTPAPTRAPTPPNQVVCDGPVTYGWALCAQDLLQCDAPYDTATVTSAPQCFAYCDAGGATVFQCAYDGATTCHRFYAPGTGGTAVYPFAGSTLYWRVGSTPGPAFSLQPFCGGSCPDVYAFDGDTFRFETDMGLYGNLAMPKGDGRGLARPQGYDYHVLETPLAARRAEDSSHADRSSSYYEVALVEDGREVNYLDRVRLFAVDLPAGLDLKEANLYPFDSFEERDVATATLVVDALPSPPAGVRVVGLDGQVSATVAADDDDDDDDVSSALAVAGDGRHVYTGSENANDPWPGAGLEIDLGPAAQHNGGGRQVLVYRGLTLYPSVKGAAKAHEVLAGRRLDGQTHVLQVFNGTAWASVPGFRMGGFPAFFRTLALDLSEVIFPVPTDRRVRLLSSFATIYDYVGISHAAPDTPAPAPLTVMELPLVGADLRYHGPVQMAPVAPGSRAHTHPDYEATVADPPAYVQGDAYTTFGDVAPLVRASDGQFVVFGVGDEVRARFGADGLPPLPAGAVRKHVLVIHNYYNNARNPLAPARAEAWPSGLPTEEGSCGNNCTVGGRQEGAAAVAPTDHVLLLAKHGRTGVL